MTDLEIELVGLEVGDWMLFEAALLLGAQLHSESFDNLTRDTLLHREHVVHRAVVLLAPEVCIGRAVDELRGDAKRRSGAPDAALENLPGPQQARDLANVARPGLGRDGGVSGRHPQRANAREIGSELLGQAVSEIRVPGVGTEIVERQDDDGLLFAALDRGHGAGALDRRGERVGKIGHVRKALRRLLGQARGAPR